MKNYIELDNQKIPYIYIDAKKSIDTIIIPGWLQNISIYQNIINDALNYSNIYFIDFFNCDLNTNLSFYSKILYILLTKTLNNTILIGHSFGGRVIFKTISLYNITNKVILISTAGIKYQKISSLLKIIKYKLLKKIYKKLNYKKYLQLINTSGSCDYKYLSNNMKQTMNRIINEDLKDHLLYINNDILLINGNKDKEIPNHYAKKYHKLLKNSNIIIIKNATHFPFISNYKETSLIINAYYQEVIK